VLKSYKCCRNVSVKQLQSKFYCEYLKSKVNHRDSYVQSTFNISEISIVHCHHEFFPFSMDFAISLCGTWNIPRIITIDLTLCFYSSRPFTQGLRTTCNYKLKIACLVDVIVISSDCSSIRHWFYSVIFFSFCFLLDVRKSNETWITNTAHLKNGLYLGSISMLEEISFFLS